MSIVKLFIIYVIGVVFGLGIVLGGMANPAKVINFFDIAGTWDPSLALVMGGALITAMIGYRIVLPKGRPMFDTRFHLPSLTTIDTRLVAGSATFGVGWGISGFCPGGALPALGTGRWEVYAFTAAMVVGIFAARWAKDRGAHQQPA